jgi:IrrE N-terminal-like domain
VSAPEEILLELGVTSPAEIDLPVIAYYLGAIIKYSKLEGCEARIIGVGDRAIIRVNSDAHPRRKRFSIAHELGHWQLHRGLNLVCGDKAFRPDLAQRGAEATANSFAGKLLLPTYLLQPVVKQHRKFDFHTIGQIADEFDTSLTATAIRILESRLAPLMLISYTRMSRKWSKKSIDLGDELVAPMQPHPETNAFKLLHSKGYKASSSKAVDARLWFNRYDLDGVKVWEDSIRTSENDVLVLLSASDQRLLRT